MAEKIENASPIFINKDKILKNEMRDIESQELWWQDNVNESVNDTAALMMDLQTGEDLSLVDLKASLDSKEDELLDITFALKLIGVGWPIEGVLPWLGLEEEDIDEKELKKAKAQGFLYHFSHLRESKHTHNINYFKEAKNEEAKSSGPQNIRQRMLELVRRD